MPFSLRRPIPAPGHLYWFLDKVLEPLALTDSNTFTLLQLLDETIFLIALAFGGCVSEIFALHQGQEFSYVSPLGPLILRPGPDFLARTEGPLNRRRPWRFSPLPRGDHSVCPATTTQVELHRTADMQHGSLFRHHASGKPLSLAAMRCRLTSYETA